MTAQTPWKNSAGVPFEPEPPKPEPRKPYPRNIADWMDERLKDRMRMREQEKRKMNPRAVPIPEPSAPEELRMSPKDRVEWERNIMRKGYGLAQAYSLEKGRSPTSIPWQQLTTASDENLNSKKWLSDMGVEHLTNLRQMIQEPPASPDNIPMSWQLLRDMMTLKPAVPKKP